MDLDEDSWNMAGKRKSRTFILQPTFGSESRRGQWLLLFTFLFSLTIPVWGGLCPPGCQCENKGLSTVCPSGELNHIPHFLNPAIKQLKVNGNKLTKLEGSLNFYNKVTLI